MRIKKMSAAAILSILAVTSVPISGLSQTNGTIRGTVTLETTESPVHNVIVTISRLNRTTETNETGAFEFENVPPGSYEVIAHLDRVPDAVQRIDVASGVTTTIDFKLKLTARREEMTVTSSGNHESSITSIQPFTSISSIQMTEKNPQSLGEVLDHQPGIAKRSFGPGNSRPVIRGFDSDRVLVVQDGNRIGSLGYQSGDHGEPIDVMSLDKLEVVKGPATLLYGSSAIGGGVDAINGHRSAPERHHR